MNLREGTRRLALLLGVVGAILGGFVSYMELQTVLSQRAQHNKFEQLAASDVVKQERKILQAWTPVPDSRPKTYLDPKTGERIQAAPNFIPDTSQKHGPWEKYAEKEKSGGALDMSTYVPSPSEVNMNGIKTINWAEKY